MSTTGQIAPALIGQKIHKTFHRATGEATHALENVSLEVRRGALTALVGPDGAGKTTLIRLAAGLMTADSGELSVLGIDVAADPQQVQNRVGYMPQRFGLYEDLSVQENLDLYADLHGVGVNERRERYPQLMAMTALGPFVHRLAGRLSGGMKQKLGLACTLIRSPELLLLDEPTVGVDPLSRRELWAIILQLVNDEGLTVLVSTSYLDEAERCGHVVVLHEGKVLAQGHPDEISGLAAGRVYITAPPIGQTPRGLQTRLLDDPAVVDALPEGGHVRVVTTAAEPNSLTLDRASLTPVPARFEDGFMLLLHRIAPERSAVAMTLERPPETHGSATVVEVHDLVRQFGTFTAVDHVSFAVRRGEIFGLLGPNGAGKTTTFRMLCGLLPVTRGTLRVAGVDLGSGRAAARQRLGYVAQKFSLYGDLSVVENLEFFASAYGLRGARRRDRIAWALEQFDLRQLMRLPSGLLPGGYKQRLAMAAALLHEPETLFLDEPTSGADPLARREFWRRITALAEQGVTVVVTTHFMEEAEYCDHMVILDHGRVMAQGSPAEIRRHAPVEAGRESTMEDAFIAIVEAGRGSGASPLAQVQVTARRQDPSSSTTDVTAKAWRMWALVKKEVRQILRDPSSIAVGMVLPVVLILLFGYALSLDVKHVPVAVVLEDTSPDAAELASTFQLSPYFRAQLLTSMVQAQDLMLASQVDGIIRIRPDFSRQMRSGDAEVQIVVHGGDANRARIIQGYAQGTIGQWTARRVAEGQAVASGPVVMQDRLWFNEANESRYFLVPGLIVLVMTVLGALLTALVVAREWEQGTFEALFVTPVRGGELLLSKVLPYLGLGIFGLVLCLLAAKFLFQVPFRGSLWVLGSGSLLYLLIALGLGLLISATVKAQFVASLMVVVTAFIPVLMLSGFLFDLNNLPVAVRFLTYVFPARYYVALLQTVLLAGDVWVVILPNVLMLAGMAALLLILTRVQFKKQLN
jgi:ABC-type multidrug transport system ATPase subunit/ABC-type multidrug transport system permease subunit